MIYLVNLKGFQPFATANKREALNKLHYLRRYHFAATLSKMSIARYINLACTRYN